MNEHTRGVDAIRLPMRGVCSVDEMDHGRGFFKGFIAIGLIGHTVILGHLHQRRDSNIAACFLQASTMYEEAASRGGSKTTGTLKQTFKAAIAWHPFETLILQDHSDTKQSPQCRVLAQYMNLLSQVGAVRWLSGQRHTTTTSGSWLPILNRWLNTNKSITGTAGITLQV